MINSGQVCQSTERVIVQRGVAEALATKMVALAQNVRAGNSYTDGAKLSAVFSEPAAESIINLIKEAQSEGATVLLGDVTRQGTLVQPHILKNVKKGIQRRFSMSAPPNVRWPMRYSRSVKPTLPKPGKTTVHARKISNDLR